MLFLFLACVAPPLGAFDSGTVHAADGGGDGGGGTVGDSGSPADSGEPGPPLEDPTSLPTLGLRLHSAEHNPLAILVSAFMPREGQVTARAWLGDQVAATATGTLGSRNELALVGLHAETTYQIEVRADLVDGSSAERGIPFTTPRLPANAQRPEVLVKDEKPEGLTIYSIGHGPFNADDALAAGVDGSGEVAWVYTADQTLPQRDVTVTRQSDGNLLVMAGDYLRTIDLAGRTLAEVRADAADLPGFHHAAWRLDDGWAALTWEERTLPVPGLGDHLVVGDVLVELDEAGNVRWRWSTFDHLDTSRFPDVLSTSPSLLDYDAADWTHSNAIVLSADRSAWLLSIRSQNWIVRINRSTGDIDWTMGEDGDIELTTGTWFNSQHAPEREPDGSLLVFDNGTTRLGSSLGTRVVRYTQDEVTRTAAEEWSLDLGVDVDHMGDVDLLDDGHMLICLGSILAPGQPEGTSELREIDPSTGTTLWAVHLPRESFAAERVPLP